MPSASARVGGGHGDNLLKGSDLPLKTQKISVVCLGVRESPKQFKSPFIMEIEAFYNKTEWALNQSNTNALITLIDDDYDMWVGYEIELAKHLTTNPRTKSQAWGLSVIGATKLKRKMKDNPKPEQKPSRF